MAPDLQLPNMGLLRVSERQQNMFDLIKAVIPSVNMSFKM